MDIDASRRGIRHDHGLSGSSVIPGIAYWAVSRGTWSEPVVAHGRRARALDPVAGFWRSGMRPSRRLMFRGAFNVASLPRPDGRLCVGVSIVSRVSCLVSRVSCLVSRVSCLVSRVSCLVSRVFGARYRVGALEIVVDPDLRIDPERTAEFELFAASCRWSCTGSASHSPAPTESVLATLNSWPRWRSVVEISRRSKGAKRTSRRVAGASRSRGSGAASRIATVSRSRTAGGRSCSSAAGGIAFGAEGGIVLSSHSECQ